MAVIDALALLAGSISAANVLTPQDVYASGASILGDKSYDTTGGTATAQVTDLGPGYPLRLLVQITTAFAGGTSADFRLVTADDAALTTNVTIIGASGAIPIASLTAGKQVEVLVPQAGPRTRRRYLGLQVTSVGANSAGACVAWLAFDAQTNNAFFGSSGFSIS